MLFRNPQPLSMRMALDQIYSSKVIEGSDSEADLSELECASKKLEAAMFRMDNLGKSQEKKRETDGPVELGFVPTTNEAIHNHSRLPARPKWLWIAKTSTIDEHGNLGFLVTDEELRRSGARPRKIYLNQPPSTLQKSFAQVVEMSREDVPSGHPWKKRGEWEKGEMHESNREEEQLRAKRQMGMGTHGEGGISRSGAYRAQEGWQGRQSEEQRGVTRLAQDQYRQGGGGEFHRQFDIQRQDAKVSSISTRRL
jgi:hypothetical protein